MCSQSAKDKTSLLSFFFFFPAFNFPFYCWTQPQLIFLNSGFSDNVTKFSVNPLSESPTAGRVPLCITLENHENDFFFKNHLSQRKVTAGMENWRVWDFEFLKERYIFKHFTKPQNRQKQASQTRFKSVKSKQCIYSNFRGPKQICCCFFSLLFVIGKKCFEIRAPRVVFIRHTLKASPWKTCQTFKQSVGAK